MVWITPLLIGHESRYNMWWVVTGLHSSARCVHPWLCPGYVHICMSVWPCYYWSHVVLRQTSNTIQWSYVYISMWTDCIHGVIRAYFTKEFIQKWSYFAIIEEIMCCYNWKLLLWSLNHKIIVYTGLPLSPNPSCTYLISLQQCLQHITHENTRTSDVMDIHVFIFN